MKYKIWNQKEWTNQKLVLWRRQIKLVTSANSVHGRCGSQHPRQPPRVRASWARLSLHNPFLLSAGLSGHFWWTGQRGNDRLSALHRPNKVACLFSHSWAASSGEGHVLSSLMERPKWQRIKSWADSLMGEREVDLPMPVTSTEIAALIISLAVTSWESLSRGPNRLACLLVSENLETSAETSTEVHSPKTGTPQKKQ